MTLNELDGVIRETSTWEVGHWAPCSPRARVLAVAGCGGGSDSSSDTGGGTPEPTKGGTFRIENTDFALSDAFDPTGEYFGAAGRSTTSCCSAPRELRVPRRQGRQRAGSGPGDGDPRAVADGLTYTFTLKDGHQVRPAGQPRDHVEGHRLRDRADRHAERRRPVRELLLGRSRASTSSARARPRRSPGIADARRQDDHLHAHQAAGRLPLRARDAGVRADPEGGGQAAHTRGRVRPLHHLVRPVHDRRRRQARHLELRRSEADLGLQPDQRA